MTPADEVEAHGARLFVRAASPRDALARAENLESLRRASSRRALRAAASAIRAPCWRPSCS